LQTEILGALSDLYSPSVTFALAGANRQTRNSKGSLQPD